MKINTLKNQIFLYFSLFTLVVIIVLSVLFFYTFSNIVTSESINRAQNTVEKSGANLEEYIDQIESLSKTLENDNSINKFFESDNSTDEDKSKAENLLKNTVAVRKDVESIVLVGRDGRLASNEPDLPMELSKNMMEMSWYDDTIKNKGKLFLTSAKMQGFSMNKESWVISTSREITDQNEKNLGVLLIDLKYNFVENVVGDMDLGSTGYIYIINEDGKLVYSKDPSCFVDYKKVKELNNIAFNDSKETDSLIITRYHLKNANWKLVALTSLDAITMLKNNVLNVILLISVILIILSFLITFIFSKKFIYPLSELEKSMLEVENGKLDIFVYKSDIKEIKSLAEKFQNMLKKLKNLMDDIKLKEQTIRESELFALQSQINPHFLYNSLETIIWMAEFKEVEKVISITSALSRFFRLSLKTGNGTTSLGDELEHIRQYLFIQGYRYKDTINYEIHIPEELYCIKVPKLILQPIVENAIDHGLRRIKKDYNPLLIIKSEEDENGDVIINIIDNGKGFDCPNNYTLPKIEEDYSYEKFDLKNTIYKTKGHSSGIGMKNVAMRINLFYGSDYGIVVNSSEKGTVVKIKLKNSILKMK